jgi:hypothetical protein
MKKPIKKQFYWVKLDLFVNLGGNFVSFCLKILVPERHVDLPKWTQMNPSVPKWQPKWTQMAIQMDPNGDPNENLEYATCIYHGYH